jgi:hypothetical protein
MHAWERVPRNDCKPETNCGAGGGHPRSPWRMANSGEPRPIEAELVPVPRMDERLIPDSLRAWVVDIAERSGFPLEYPPGHDHDSKHPPGGFRHDPAGPGSALLASIGVGRGGRGVHAADRAQPAVEPVSLRSAHAAAAWCDLLEAHARRIYQSALDGDVDAAIHLGQRIKGETPHPFTVRAVARKGRSGLTTGEEVRRAAGIFQHRDWLKSVEVPTDRHKGDRPTEVYWIYPRLIAGPSADAE